MFFDGNFLSFANRNSTKMKWLYAFVALFVVVNAEDYCMGDVTSGCNGILGKIVKFNYERMQVTKKRVETTPPECEVMCSHSSLKCLIFLSTFKIRTKTKTLISNTEKVHSICHLHFVCAKKTKCLRSNDAINRHI